MGMRSAPKINHRNRLDGAVTQKLYIGFMNLVEIVLAR